MSCRVIARTVEQFMFADVLECCRRLGHRTVVGEYIPTKKNVLVSNLYDDLGFRRLPDSDGGVVRYTLDIEGAMKLMSFVQVRD